MNKQLIYFIALGICLLGGCATPPATKDHMLATYAHQHGFKLASADGKDMYCSTRTHGTHQCVDKATMIWYMDHTSNYPLPQPFPAALPSSGYNDGSGG
jgi:hypothetical protein